MKISIITPVYNDPRIRSCLESVAAQRGDFDLERIVVDGESTDETVDIIEEYDDQIDLLIREDDDGMYDAVNKGLERASGDIIGVINADDRYQDEQVLADVADTMANSTVGLCYGDLVYVNEDDDVVRYWQSGRFRPYKFYLGWMPPHPTLFVRTGVYEEYGMFDTSFDISADYELILRLMHKTDVSVRYIDRVLVRMAIGGMSNSSVMNVLQVVRDMYGSWEKHEPRGRFIAPFLHPLEKIPQFLRSPPESAVRP